MKDGDLCGHGRHFGFKDMNGTIIDLTHGTGNVCGQVPIRIILYLSLTKRRKSV